MILRRAEMQKEGLKHTDPHFRSGSRPLFDGRFRFSNHFPLSLPVVTPTPTGRQAQPFKRHLPHSEMSDGQLHKLERFTSTRSFHTTLELRVVKTSIATLSIILHLRTIQLLPRKSESV